MIEYEKCEEHIVLGGAPQCLICNHITDVSGIGRKGVDFIYLSKEGYAPICWQCSTKLGDTIQVTEYACNYWKAHYV